MLVYSKGRVMLKNHIGTKTPVLYFCRGSKEERKKKKKKKRKIPHLFRESLFEDSLRLKEKQVS